MGLGSFVTGYLADYVFNNTASPYTWSLVAVGATGTVSILCFYIASFNYKKDAEFALQS